jgi:F1F0 ATPase subunit 2
MMRETSTFVLALLAGVLLGTIFFGGLWWTIRRGVSSERPATWFFGSLMLRTIIAVAGFYLISRGDWRRLLAGLLGFLVARALVTRLTRDARPSGASRDSRASRAPIDKAAPVVGGGRR